MRPVMATTNAVAAVIIPVTDCQNPLIGSLSSFGISRTSPKDSHFEWPAETCRDACGSICLPGNTSLRIFQDTAGKMDRARERINIANVVLDGLFGTAAQRRG